MKYLLAYLLVFSFNSVLAAPFTAVCDADGVHAYRNSTDINGDVLPPEWTTEENFFANWSFHFDGESFSINGDQATIVYNGENHLVVIEGGLAPDGESVSYWMYAINFDLNEIVGSQVNSYTSIGEITGIKSRAVNFLCEFSYH